MTDREREIVAAYVHDRCEELGLRDWQIVWAKSDPPDADDCLGMMTPVEGRQHAALWLCPDFRQLSPETQRETIIHELLHCNQRPFNDLVRCALPRPLGQHAYDLFYHAYKDAVEVYTDGLATALAPKFPLIDWGDA